MKRMRIQLPPIFGSDRTRVVVLFEIEWRWGKRELAVPNGQHRRHATPQRLPSDSNVREDGRLEGGARLGFHLLSRTPLKKAAPAISSQPCPREPTSTETEPNQGVANGRRGPPLRDYKKGFP